MLSGTALDCSLVLDEADVVEPEIEILRIELKLKFPQGVWVEAHLLGPRRLKKQRTIPGYFEQLPRVRQAELGGKVSVVSHVRDHELQPHFGVFIVGSGVERNSGVARSVDSALILLESSAQG